VKRAAAALLLVMCLGQEVEGKPRRGLEIAGGVLLAVGYLSALALAARYEVPELALPVLGPLIALRRCDPCTATPAQSGVVSLLAVDTVVQAAGVGLLWSGLTIHRRKQPPLHVQPGVTGVTIRF
jgi:hypothetical protein